MPRIKLPLVLLALLALVAIALGCTQHQINSARDAEAVIFTGEQIGCLSVNAYELAAHPAAAPAPSSGPEAAIVAGCAIVSQLRDYARRLVDVLIAYAQRQLDARHAAASAPSADAGPPKTPTEANGWRDAP